MRVSYDKENDRVFVLPNADDSILDMPMIRVEGVWSRGVFDADELKDYFVWVKDTEDANTYIQEAVVARLLILQN